MYPLSLLLCCFFRYGKKTIISQKGASPGLLHVSGWPHYFHYLLLRLRLSLAVSTSLANKIR